MGGVGVHHCCLKKTVFLQKWSSLVLMITMYFSPVGICLYAKMCEEVDEACHWKSLSHLAKPQEKPHSHLYLHYCCLSSPMRITAQPSSPKPLSVLAKSYPSTYPNGLWALRSKLCALITSGLQDETPVWIAQSRKTKRQCESLWKSAQIKAFQKIVFKYACRNTDNRYSFRQDVFTENRPVENLSEIFPVH